MTLARTIKRRMTRKRQKARRRRGRRGPAFACEPPIYKEALKLMRNQLEITKVISRRYE